MRKPRRRYVFVGVTSRPNGRCDLPITEAMIARRNAIAVALGYERCACTIRPGPGGSPCWERVDKSHTLADGHKTSSRHVVAGPDDRHAVEGRPLYEWPDDVQKAAWAVDHGKPLETDPFVPPVKPRQARLFEDGRG